MRETLKRFAGTVVGHVTANVCLSMRTKTAVLQELRAGRCGWGVSRWRWRPEQEEGTRNLDNSPAGQRPTCFCWWRWLISDVHLIMWHTFDCQGGLESWVSGRENVQPFLVGPPFLAMSCKFHLANAVSSAVGKYATLFDIFIRLGNANKMGGERGKWKFMNDRGSQRTEEEEGQGPLPNPAASWKSFQQSFQVGRQKFLSQLALHSINFAPLSVHLSPRPSNHPAVHSTIHHLYLLAELQ